MNQVGIVGDIILDILLQVDHFPKEDSEVILKGEQFNLGGSAFNTAFELSATKHHPLLLATHGNDKEGQFVKSALNAIHLDRSFIREESTNTGKIYIILSPNGKRTMISSRSSMPIPLDMRLYDQFINQICWLHISGYLLSEENQFQRAIYAMKKAKEKAIPCSLDPGTNPVKNHPEKILEALTYTDYLLPNREEFTLLNHHNELIKRSDSRIIIVKDGPKGSTIVTSKGSRTIESQNSLSINNSIGAGDAFNAGFIDGILSSGDLTTACKTANECAYQRLLKQQG